MKKNNFTAKSVFGNHDEQAHSYDTNIYVEVENQKNYIREKYFEVHAEVLRMADLKNGEQVLDIGIGTGLLEEKMKGKINMFGIDISEKMLKKAKEKNLSIELKMGSFNSIPYPDKTFDTIISCFAFHHLTDREKKLSIVEMKRVLKNKGRIVIGDLMYLNIESKKILEEKFFNENRNDVIEDMEDEYFTDVEWLKKKLEERKFEVECKHVSTLSWVIKAKLN